MRMEDGDETLVNEGSEKCKINNIMNRVDKSKHVQASAHTT